MRPRANSEPKARTPEPDLTEPQNGKVFIQEWLKTTWRPEMNTITFSTGVLSIGIAIYLLLGIVYPFIAAFEHPVLGHGALFVTGILFGMFGSFLCWEAATVMEDKRTDKRIRRKRRRLLLQS
ncbi:MAG: hypothetical protein ABIG39_00085 [Candidatus Micrarchaeota archaeon]